MKAARLSHNFSIAPTINPRKMLKNSMRSRQACDVQIDGMYAERKISFASLCDTFAVTGPFQQIHR
jgi:hypothetical protein